MLDDEIVIMNFMDDTILSLTPEFWIYITKDLIL
jgi:hypothetical protein